MIIGCDVDGVLADFNTGFIARVIQVTGRDLFPPRPFDIPTWNYPEHYGYTAEEVFAVWEHIKKDTDFWASLPRYPDTLNALYALRDRQREGDQVYFVTARLGVRAKQQTEAWLHGSGFYQPTVLVSSAKGLCAQALKMERYLDDRWENVLDVASHTEETDAYMLMRPWNRERESDRYGIVEVASVEAFLNE